jgi:hypothetical protein
LVILAVCGVYANPIWNGIVENVVGMTLEVIAEDTVKK